MSKKILAIILTICLLSVSLLACNSSGNATDPTPTNPTETQKPTEKYTKKPTEKPTEAPEYEEVVLTNSKAYDKPADYETDPLKDGITIDGVDISEFAVVYATDGEHNTVAESCAEQFADWVYDNLEIELTVRSDGRSSDHEIIFGEADRPQSEQAVENGFECDYDFNAVLEDGKLALVANSSMGYLVALGSLKTMIIANNGSVTEGFSNNRLSYEDIKEFSVGSIKFDVLDEGLRFYKSTDLQSEVWWERCKNWQYNKNAPDITNGVRLDFETNSSFVYFEVSAGSCVLLVNGLEVKTGTKAYFYALDATKGPNRVTIILPEKASAEWTLKELQLSPGSVATPHKFDLNMLILGDSITQGYNNNGNAASTYTFFTSQYFNANSVVQGNGGAKFDLDDLDPALNQYYNPDVIIVSFGTNDWSAYKNENVSFFENRLDAYLDKLESIFPDTPIIGITPINRLTDTSGKTTFDQARAAYKNVYQQHGALVVDGANMLPSNEEYFADTVHPNAQGFIIYGKNLCAAIEAYINDLTK